MERSSANPMGRVSHRAEFDLGETLMNLSCELTQVVQSCDGLQAAVSGLLEQIGDADNGADVQALQNLDRMQQTLEDIAALLCIAAETGRGLHLDPSACARAVRLASLRERLGWLPPEAKDREDQGELSGHVDWL